MENWLENWPFPIAGFKASGYLLKTCAAAELVHAVRESLRGYSYLSSPLSQDAIDCLRWEHKKLVQEDQCLTKRQRQVLRLLDEAR
jgi:DNA-binding NarL/FixJ family response regulator